MVLSSNVGSSASFIITSSQSWSISKKDGDSWFSVYPMSGEAGTTTVTITIDEANPHYDDRSSNITVGNYTITITQKKLNALILSPYKQQVASEGEILEITMMHNLNYSVIINQNWIKQISGKGLETETLYFQIDPMDNNDLWDGRYGEIIIKDKDSDLTDTVNIYQNTGDRLIIYPETNSTQYVTFEGGTFDIVLRSNISYEAKIVDEQNVDWLRFTPTPKSNYREDTYSFEVDPYDDIEKNRTAKVAFKNTAGTVTDTLYVVQSYMGAVFTTQSEYDIDYNTNVFNVILNVNTEDITYKVDYTGGTGWITTEEVPEVKSVFYEKVMIFKALQNYSPSARKATVTLIVPGSGESQSFTVSQGTGSEWDQEVFGQRAMYVQRSIRHANSAAWNGADSVLVSWRSLPGETVAFDVYKVSNGESEVKLNIEPIVSSTNYVDRPDFSVNNTYILKIVGTDVELDRYEFTFANAEEPWITIPVIAAEAPDAEHPYQIVDACVGDLTGNGKYDIVIRRECNSASLNETKALVGETYMEAYTFDGQFLWRVGLGPNIPQGEHTVPFVVYDLDGDGRAELIVRTSELTTFGDGYQVPGTNYSSDSNPFAIGAPEYLSVIDGMTGALKAQTAYIDPGPKSQWENTWGDSYGNRANRHLMAIGYFDGSTPSLFVSRGYYPGQTIMQTWDLVGGQLVQRWEFKAAKNGPNASYDGQGNHSINIADLNGDGRDDVIFGSMAVDSYGKPLYSYGYGHGDAISVGKFIKGSKGLQIWSCFETGTTGASFRDGIGREFFKLSGAGDIGRSLIANFHPDHNGYLMWAFHDNGAYYDTDGNKIGYLADHSSNWARYMSMAVWWTGSLNRQLTWRNTLDAFNGTGFDRIQNFNPMGGAGYSNKDCPLWYGDIFGDWREELIYAKSDHTAILIYSTSHETKYRIPYLMSDRTYRLSAINQNVGYNQPTNTGFYMGPDMFD